MIGHVFKNNVKAATLRRDGASTVFAYDMDYVNSGGAPLATTLPLTMSPAILPGGSVPAFFAGLLPEGRRLNALVRTAKTSADDELGLLLAVGTATIGDVYVLEGETAQQETPTVRIPPDPAELNFAELMTTQGISLNPRLAGVQDKASAQMISFHASKANVDYLIKFDPPEFPHLCQNEKYFLDRAHKLRLDVAQAQLLTDNAGAHALLVKRFDRRNKELVHVEDGAQVLGRYPADKYNLSFEEVAAELARQTLSGMASSINLMTQLAFAWLTGNGDLHAKNLSLVGTSEGALIAPMYDLPSSLFYSDLDPELALTVDGVTVLTPPRFNAVGHELGLPTASLNLIRQRVLKVTSDLAEHIEAGALPFDSKITAKVGRQLRRRHAEFGSGL